MFNQQKYGLFDFFLLLYLTYILLKQITTSNQALFYFAMLFIEVCYWEVVVGNFWEGFKWMDAFLLMKAIGRTACSLMEGWYSSSNPTIMEIKKGVLAR